MLAIFNTWFKSLSDYAINNPSQFLFTVLLILSPFFALSAFLSWKLAKHLEKEEKRKKSKEKMISNIKSNAGCGPRVKKD